MHQHTNTWLNTPTTITVTGSAEYTIGNWIHYIRALWWTYVVDKSLNAAHTLTNSTSSDLCGEQET